MVCLGIRSIADEDAGVRSSVDLQVMCLDQGKCTTADLPQMGKGRFVIEPKLKWGSILQCRCGGEIGEVRGSAAEFIPKQKRGVAHQAHGASFVKDGAVNMLGASIVGGSIGGGQKVIDSKGRTPISCFIGKKFSIVGDQDL